MIMADIEAPTMYWLLHNLPSVYAGISALLIAALLAIRDLRPVRHILTSAAICGQCGVCFCGMLQYFGFPDNSAAAFGAVVGFVGADRLRGIVLMLVRRKTGESSDDRPDENQ